MVFEDIIFLQDEDAIEALKILEMKGEQEALKYLLEWDYGEGPVRTLKGVPWGTLDQVYRYKDYIMTYNTGIGYIGLIKQLSDEPECYRPTAGDYRELCKGNDEKCQSCKWRYVTQ